MKLLFDENLSPALARRFSGTCPGSAHVSQVGLARALDEPIWQFARDNGYVLVTRDYDFSALAQLRGAPPLVVHLLIGNCATLRVEEKLREHLAEIEHLADAATSSLFQIY